MKWTVENPKFGDIRIKTKFALFPIIAGKECRWLERVSILQIYSTAWSGWKNQYFINE
jgi:hypothetical protein